MKPPCKTEPTGRSKNQTFHIISTGKKIGSRVSSIYSPVFMGTKAQKVNVENGISCFSVIISQQKKKNKMLVFVLCFSYEILFIW